MYSYSKISNFYEYLEYGPHKNEDETKKYLESLIKRCEEGSHNGDAVYWGIIDKTENILIGTIGLVGIKNDELSACSTMGLSTEYRDKGRALEAMISLLEFGFNKMSLKRIWSLTNVNNKAVIMSHKLFGFKEEKELKEYYLIKDKYANAKLLACLKEDFTCKKAITTIALSRLLK